MSDIEPIRFGPVKEATSSGGLPGSQPCHLASISAQRPPFIAFRRHELDHIFFVYGRMVAQGEWRDYAIDMLRDRAVFSVFRRACERPLYRIEKHPKLARKQGAYCVIATTGLILKRGHDLKKVLRVLDKRLKLVDA